LAALRQYDENESRVNPIYENEEDGGEGNYQGALVWRQWLQVWQCAGLLRLTQPSLQRLPSCTVVQPTTAGLTWVRREAVFAGVSVPLFPSLAKTLLASAGFGEGTHDQAGDAYLEAEDATFGQFDEEGDPGCTLPGGVGLDFGFG
jgi:hypothetical protein